MKLEVSIPKVFSPIISYKGKYIIVDGGRGSGKSHTVATLLIAKAIAERKRILCSREVQNSIAESVKTLLELIIAKYNLDSVFTVRTNSIVCNQTGSEIIFKGIKDQTVNSIKSYEAIDICWVEEAQTLTRKSWEILYPTIRKPNSQLFMTINPTNASDVVYEEFIFNANKRNDFLRITANYIDNPFLSAEYLNEIENDKRILASEVFNHIWLGEIQRYSHLRPIDVSRFKRYDSCQKQQYKKVLMILDTAYGTREANDYSVIATVGYTGDECHLMHITRGQWDFDMLLKMTLDQYMFNQNSGLHIEKILIENKASGISLIQKIKKTGLPLKALNPVKDKFTRLQNVIDRLDKFALPLTSGFVKEFLKECDEFRADMKHEHDDQVDVMIYALDEINKKSGVQVFDF